MSSTFRFHSQVNELVPANATYQFPTQSTKVNKQVVKLVPKNGSTFASSSIVRIEFPADNYLNVLNSCLQFDVQITRAPRIVTTVLATNITAADVATAGPVNSNLVVSICSTVPTGGTPVSAANVPETGTWASTVNAYAGCTLTVYRSGLCYTAVIHASDVATFVGTQGSATGTAGRQQILYLGTALPCGPIATGDVLTIHYPQTLQRGGASNFIKRLRVIYGSLVLEDIYEYKTLVRIMYELGVQRDYGESHGQIGEGINCTATQDHSPTGYIGTTTFGAGLRPFDNTDQLSAAVNYTGNASSFVTGGTATGGGVSSLSKALVLQSQLLSSVATPETYLSRLDSIPLSYVNSSGTYISTPTTLFNYGQKTYCINLLSGLFTQKKLIPLKWMAAQLVIEITLATPEDCFLSTTTSNALTYEWRNVNFIAEMLEFDSTYDTGLYDGLRSAGIPIKFGTFHYHTFNLTGTNQVLQIHERSRSVKAAFAVIRTTQANSLLYDSDRLFASVGETFDTTTGYISSPSNGAIDTFQFRVGGRYYPAQPVRCQNGAAEALIEIQKVLDNLGDYTRGSQLTKRNWVSGSSGLGSAFVIGCEFENTDVFPDTIAGINAEEQSDIALTDRKSVV